MAAGYISESVDRVTQDGSEAWCLNWVKAERCRMTMHWVRYVVDSTTPGSPTSTASKAPDLFVWRLSFASQDAIGSTPEPHFNGHTSSATTNSSPSKSSLNKLFDEYRDDPNDPDKIAVEGSMRYLENLGLKLDEVALLAVLTELGAPTMGEFTRQGFIEGWSSMRADSLPKQQEEVHRLRNATKTNSPLFKKTYKATFPLARAPGAKVLPLETAIEYWRLLLGAPANIWKSKTTAWLDLWIEFLETKWKKAVNKDMWDQTGIFVGKSTEDEGMGFWSEDGAWPGVIDDFVAFVRERRGAGAGAAQGEEMDVG